MSHSRSGLTAAEIEILSLKPGDRAHVEVEIYEPPQTDMTHVRVAMPGFIQRFWLPTRLLRIIPKLRP